MLVALYELTLDIEVVIIYFKFTYEIGNKLS